MKLKQPGEPDDDGHYQLSRDLVLKVLKDNEVVVTKIHSRLDSFLLEQGDEFICLILPSKIPAQMVFRLANTFSILPDKFYENKSH